MFKNGENRPWYMLWAGGRSDSLAFVGWYRLFEEFDAMIQCNTVIAVVLPSKHESLDSRADQSTLQVETKPSATNLKRVLRILHVAVSERGAMSCRGYLRVSPSNGWYSYAAATR